MPHRFSRALPKKANPRIYPLGPVRVYCKRSLFLGYRASGCPILNFYVLASTACSDVLLIRAMRGARLDISAHRTVEIGGAQRGRGGVEVSL